MLLDDNKNPHDLSFLSDEQVLRESVDNPALFAELVGRYEKALVRKAVKILGNTEDAEDVVQETFTKVYLNANRFHDVSGASFKSWVYKILLNTSFSCYRKLKRRREVTFNIPPEMLSLIPDGEEVFEKEEIRDYVASLLTKIPKNMADVLQLHFLQGKSQKEIAAEAEVSVGAIKTRIYRAKRELKKINSEML